MIANCRANRPKHSPAARPQQFHPFARRGGKDDGMTIEQFQALKRGIKKAGKALK